MNGLCVKTGIFLALAAIACASDTASKIGEYSVESGVTDTFYVPEKSGIPLETMRLIVADLEKLEAWLHDSLREGGVSYKDSLCVYYWALLMDKYQLRVAEVQEAFRYYNTDIGRALTLFPDTTLTP